MEKNSPSGNRSSELPDYEHEVVHAPPVRVGWFSNPQSRKKLLRFVILILILAALPPVYRWIKNVRAESLLGKSSKAFALGDGQQGIELLKQALALSPGNVAIQQSVELFNARIGDQPSREKLISRMRAGASSKEELLGLADLEASSGHPEVVAEILSHIPKNTSSKEGLRIALIESAMAAYQGSLPKAAAICLQEKGSSLGKEDRDLLRTRGALYLLSENDVEARNQAVKVLMEVIRAKTEASLPAWKLMARLALDPSGEGSALVSSEQIAELIRVFPSLRASGSQDRLLLADLKIKVDPATQPRVVAELSKENRSAPRTEKLEFARWLNAKGLYQEVISFAGPDLPRSDTDWLLVVLDAQGAQGHWQEMAGMMETPAGAGIPDAVKHLYLARTAMMNGNQTAADEEWRHVGGTLHLEKPETIAYIAGYEEKIGEFSRAARAYRELADRKETRLPGLIGLIRCQPRTASATTLIPLYEELLAVQPANTDATCDLTYLKLLKPRDYEEAPAIAEKLLTEQPNSLPRISTAALGRLRSNNAHGALALYHDKAIDWTAIPEPWKVVYCAVLKANGHTAEAAELESSLHTSQLRPEERALLK
jgi:tetratricopeptide (TPR) repeat protein